MDLLEAYHHLLQIEPNLRLARLDELNLSPELKDAVRQMLAVNEFVPGSLIDGQYKIIKQLGNGVSSVVWLASPDDSSESG